MNTLLKKITKQWFYISLAFTILSSIVTGGWYLKGEIDRSAETLIESKITVKENTKAIQTLSDRVIKLEEDERIHELGDNGQ